MVVLGDSLAERAPWSALLGVPVVNAGYGGMLTREVTEWAVEVLHPDVETVVVWVGTNDAMEAYSRERVAADQRALVDTIRESSPAARIICLTLPPLGAHAQQVEEHAAVLAQLADEGSLTVADVTPRLRSAGMLIGDGVHISGRGYEVVGHAMREALRRLTK